jgi:DNA-binding NarL/FixJ family response regulator
MPALPPETIEALRELDALDRVSAAGRLIEEHRQAMAVLAQIRSHAVAELRAEGHSLAEIARHLNVTRQQVHRLENASPG